jgi:hypothetical protein
MVRKTQLTRAGVMKGLAQRPTETEGWPTIMMRDNRGLGLLGEVSIQNLVQA